MKTKQDVRAQTAEKCIRMVWNSMESHLKYMHTKDPDGFIKNSDGKVFHKKTVKQYAELICYITKLI